ncbi:MAG: DUF6265 family protein [Bacteroidota bacterium]
MRYLLFCLFLFFLLSCNKQTNIQQIEWLIGKWENQTTKGSIYESWEKKSPNELRAISYKLSGSDTLFLETIQILQEEDGLFFIPTVPSQNQGLPIRFKMTSFTETDMTFENPDHDFPQKINYKMISTDSLVAVVSAIHNGKEDRRFFKMRRVK